MKKIKILSIMIISALIGTGIVSTSTAVQLDGQIDVEIRELFGLVAPIINIENTTVVFPAEPYDYKGTTQYYVNSTLEIELVVSDNSGRNDTFLPYLFGRPLFYSAFMWRMPKITLKGGFLQRFIPTFVPLRTVNVVNSTFGKDETTTIQLPVNYTIADAAVTETEEMTLHLLCMGMPPGDVNGIAGIKIISHKKIALDVSYSVSS
jgi:hypothetical protein